MTPARSVPTGAKYSPDFTYQELLAKGRIDLLSRTLVRRVVVAPESDRIEYVEAVDRDRPDEPVRIRAATFVSGGGLRLELTPVCCSRQTIASRTGWPTRRVSSAAT